MTGYARAQGHDEGLAWIWEVKSVNGRGLEIRCRLPNGYDALELPAREAVQRRCKRGTINIGLALRRDGGGGGPVVDETRLARLAELAVVWQRRLPDFTPPSIDGLLALRGVIDAGEAEDDVTAAENHLPAMMATLERSLDALAAARAAEGARISDVLAVRLDEIAGLLGRAAASAALDPVARRERLRQQVQTFLDAVPAFSEERLLQEAALLTAKGDVKEELDRLVAHVAAARDLLAAGEGVGRRLDFLCQEFNREANTLCAKAGDLALTAIGLDLKAAIEQFREQVQNIE